MNKGPEEITTKITKDGILTIDLNKEKKEYLKCNNGGDMGIETP